MTQHEKTPVEKAVDLLVYAPIGMASLARTMLPGIIEQGRQKVETRVNQARVLSQFAIQQGQYEVNKISGQVKHAVDDPAPSNGEGTRAAAPAPDEQPTDPSESAAATPQAPTEPAPAVGDLAIPGYQSLSASQVVPRLSGLEADDLDAVRRYEAATRGRKTILNRIAQLQAD